MYIKDKLKKELDKLIGIEITDNIIITEIKSYFHTLGIAQVSELINPLIKVDNGYATNCTISYNGKQFMFYLIIIGKKKSKKTLIQAVRLDLEAIW